MNKYEQLLPKELLKEYEAAPAHIRELIQSGRLFTIVGAIHKKHALHVDVTNKMITELFLALFGITDWKNLYTALVDTAGVPEQYIDAVLEELNAQIFVPLQQKLRATTPVASAPAPTDRPTTAQQSSVPTSPVVSSKIAVASPTIKTQSSALEVPPTHEITLRTMKNDAVSVKAGEKPSRFVMPLIKKETAPVASNPVSKYLKPLGVTPPPFAEATKPAFSSRFSSVPTKIDPVSLPRPSTLPPQTFLPIKVKEPAIKIDPLKTLSNTGTSFIPKAPVVPQAQDKTMNTFSSTAAIPVQPNTPAPKPTLTVPKPPVPVPPATPTKKLDPYREIPE